MPRTWTHPSDLAGDRPARGDEFPPEVALAMSDLRARGGLPPTPEDADAQREQLHFQMAGVNRRGFLQLTGAAAVVAMVAGCGKKPHPDTLVAYDQQPAGVTIGAGVGFSTSVRVHGRPSPVVAKSYDGRPIKLDGNPDHPLVDGRSDAATQAALLDLYDPDRGGVDPAQPGVHADGPRGPEGRPCTWRDLDTAVAAALKGAGRIGLLTGPLTGPAELALRDQMVAAFGGRLVHAAYHPFADDAAVEARRRLHGAATSPVYRLDEAQVLLALGSDILADGIAAQVGFGRFRRPRVPGGARGQVIAFEPTLSQIGTVADVRVRVAMDRLAWVAWAIAAEVARELQIALPPAIAAALPGARLDLRPVRSGAGEIPAVRFAAERLLAVRRTGGASLVHVGGATHAGPESLDLHLVATWLNTVLGNEGRSVVAGPVRASLAAARELLGSDLQALVVMGPDPAFSLPGAAAAIARIPLVVSLNAGRDETTRLAHWHAPGLHDLEAWGDASLAPGWAELRQPLVQPLWDARAAEESLMAFAVEALGEAAPAVFRVPRTPVPPQGGLVSVASRKPLWSAAERGIRPWRDLVQAVWCERVQPLAGTAATGTAFWNAALARGFVALPGPAPVNPGLKTADLPVPPAPRDGLMLVATAARTVGDGAALNNAWLQELPDPVSKICWDGYAALSPTDAKAAGIETGDVIELAVDGTLARLPAHVQEGQHPGCVEVFLGWGRRHAGLVAGITAEDGHRANAFLLADRRWGAAVTVAKTGLRYELASSQAHHRMAGRPIALDMVEGVPLPPPAHGHWEAGTDGKPGGRLSIWRKHQTHPGHRWGMSIDLDACTGCGACMVACSAENNVPVVGRDEVRKTRDMHWIRIDRYYLGEDDLDVAVTHQPMLCQHCDHAPCEAVCPANATVKSDEGVNVQVYNRCIGTRYCSNNCPYKVRRFNWYQYSSFRAGPQGAADPLGRLAKNVVVDGSDAGAAELAHKPLHLLLNPEVTVRHRGVMEKCNFCMQRQRQIRDGKAGVTSACAQACPTAAIVFGDLNDPQSAVARAGDDPRAHLVLDHEFNTRPKVAYLRKVRSRPATAADEERHG